MCRYPICVQMPEDYKDAALIQHESQLSLIMDSISRTDMNSYNNDDDNDDFHKKNVHW